MTMFGEFVQIFADFCFFIEQRFLRKHFGGVLLGIFGPLLASNIWSHGCT